MNENLKKIIDAVEFFKEVTINCFKDTRLNEGEVNVTKGIYPYYESDKISGDLYESENLIDMNNFGDLIVTEEGKPFVAMSLDKDYPDRPFLIYYPGYLRQGFMKGDKYIRPKIKDIDLRLSIKQAQKIYNFLRIYFQEAKDVINQ